MEANAAEKVILNFLDKRKGRKTSEVRIGKRFPRYPIIIGEAKLQTLPLHENFSIACIRKIRNTYIKTVNINAGRMYS